MAEVGIKELLEAGVHFGHQTRRWDPSMRRYIHGERDGIHVIDLLQTEKLLAQATEFVSEVAGRGGKVLFVGTKKQARDSVQEWAGQSGMPFVSRRWLGGLLTNFQTINRRIGRLHELNALKSEDKLELLPTKEQMTMEAELEKLEYNLGGVRDMQRVPEAVIVIDLNTEEIAVAEASRLGIPIIGLVDTNCDPGPVDYVIPGNDDAIRSCELIVRTLGEAITESASAWQQAEAERRRREEEERKRREEEERKRKEAEEAARQAAEQEAKAKAEAASAGQGAQAQGKGGGEPQQQRQQASPQQQRQQASQQQQARKPRGRPVPREQQAAGGATGAPGRGPQEQGGGGQATGGSGEAPGTGEGEQATPEESKK